MSGRGRKPGFVRAATVLFAVLATSAVVLWAMNTAGWNTPGGKPVALDFDPYWSAARLALAGHARDAYDNAIIEAFERAHTRLDQPGYLAFYYPPPFLLLCLPLGLLPYLPALFAFLAAQAALLWTALRRILPAGWALLPVLSYPGMLMNIFSGQNGGFSAACFAGAAIWLERRPALAGACLGVLVCKPQIALPVPVALFAARRWRAAGWAAVTAGLLCLASFLVLGSGPWEGFFANAPAARGDLEHLAIKWPLMQSFYAGIRMAGFGARAGYAGQAALAILALALLGRICWRGRDGGAEMAALAVTSLLVTPFLYDYDLMIMAPSLAWLAARTAAGQKLPGEAPLLLTLYFLPFAARAAGLEMGVALAPPLVLLLLLSIARRSAAA